MSFGENLQSKLSATDEHLHPQCTSFIVMFATYHATVARHLLPHHGNSSFFGVVCCPSFEPEWAVYLWRCPKRDKDLLVLTVAESQIWRLPTPSDSPVKRLEAELSDDLIHLLATAWRKMLLACRNSDEQSEGLDGLTYHFQFGRMAGQTWSTNPHTAPGKLVQLSNLLRDFCETSESRRQKLIPHVRELATWLCGHVA